MKKIIASLLVVLFVLMILGAANQAYKTHRQPGDVAGAIGALMGYLLLWVGLYFSAQWRIQLAGHTYKVGRQTVATLLFWYAVFAAFVGLMMPLLLERTPFTFAVAAIMVVLWSSVAYACKRWQQRLRAAERSRLDVSPA
jgi:hypothetical protein